MYKFKELWKQREYKNIPCLASQGSTLGTLAQSSHLQDTNRTIVGAEGKMVIGQHRQLAIIRKMTCRKPVAIAISSSSTPPTHRTAGKFLCSNKWFASSSKPHWQMTKVAPTSYQTEEDCKDRAPRVPKWKNNMADSHLITCFNCYPSEPT